ncbi:MAG: hypothetical protein KIT72_12990 [Polyangiaceae bacterium]|nr:hypothetical protein [Polyangiaceae bacterium]MCW5791326.1 hypothetical protein [Polyangiaceae bacterium]
MAGRVFWALEGVARRVARSSRCVPALAGRGSLAALVAVALMGCGADEAEPTPGLSPADLDHHFDPISLEPGFEDAGTCLSWTLHNEEELWVHRVDGFNGGGWHHSNWFFVAEDDYPGEDGAWDCEARGFDLVRAGLRGGVFFAQSTQATHDIQQFPEGAAFRIPPRSRVVGQAHLFNTSARPIESGFQFEVRTLPAEQVTEVLRPISMTNMLLDIPPQSRSRFDMSCPIAPSYQEQLGTTPDFELFYVLPHYHELGAGLRLSMVGGTRDDVTIFETRGGVGDPLGATLNPPVRFAGAEGVRLTCEYDNPRDVAVGYGIGDQEMCVFLAFTNSPLTLAATSFGVNQERGLEAGVHVFDTPCLPLAVP